MSKFYFEQTYCSFFKTPSNMLVVTNVEIDNSCLTVEITNMGSCGVIGTFSGADLFNIAHNYEYVFEANEKKKYNCMFLFFVEVFKKS